MIYNINNGASTGNMIIRVSVPNDKVGETITCTLGSTVLTDIIPASLTVEFKIKDFGDWIIVCDDLSKTINTYYYGLYLVVLEHQSVELVPIMTSNNTPYGEIIFDSNHGDYPPKYAFDRNNNTRWGASSGKTANAFIGYHLVNPAVVKKVFLYPYYGSTSQGVGNFVKNYRIEASNDNSNWTTLYTGLAENTNKSYEINLENFTAYSYYRVYVIDSFNYGIGFTEIQFYGYEPI